MLGVDVELHAKEVAPAFELDQTIGLTLLRPLGDRQPARDRKDLAVVAGLVAQLGAVLAHHCIEPRSAEIGPRRDRSKEIIDDLGHYSGSPVRPARLGPYPSTTLRMK